MTITMGANFRRVNSKSVNFPPCGKNSTPLDVADFSSHHAA
jgi:hypothetical protein